MDILKNLKDMESDVADKIKKINLPEIIPNMLPKISHKSAKDKLGKSPGSIIYTGKPRDEKVKVQVMDYTKPKLNEFEAKKIEEVFKFRDKKSTTWINITGVHDVEMIKKIGEHFKLHNLLLEDVVSINQRPKIEDFDDNIFLVMKIMIRPNSLQCESLAPLWGLQIVKILQVSLEREMCYL